MAKNFQEIVKKERMPAIWCAGCGIHLVFNALAKEMFRRGWSEKDTTVISGIGCSGRMAGYFNLDSVHTTHGRALPVAEGIKLVQPNLNVVVVSGDGDLASIGGNHLLHAARYNLPITAILINNETYGMTGGQASPLTGKGSIAVTAPQGVSREPLRIQYLLAASRTFWYARTSAFEVLHLEECLIAALDWPGFRLIEVLSFCPERFGKQNKITNPSQYNAQMKGRYKIRTRSEGFLKSDELGIVSQANEK